MTEKTLPSHVASYLYESDPGETWEGWTLKAKQPGDSGRWMQHYTLVVADEAGAFWGVAYAEGLTEYQDDDRPWEERDEVPLVPLYPHQIVSTEYRTKPVQPQPEATA